MNKNLIAGLWMLFAGFGATIMTFGVRALSGYMDVHMIAFLRVFLCLWIIIPWFFMDKLNECQFKLPWLHFLRGLLMASALSTAYYAIWKLPLSTATTLFFLAPIFATALAGPLLGEHVGPRRWFAVLVGLIGALVIIRPGIEPFNLAMLSAIASSAFYSISLLLSKILLRNNKTEAVYISSTVVATIAIIPLAAPVMQMPASSQYLLIIIMVLGASLRTFADIKAYGIGDAGFIAPIVYLRLVFVAVGAYFLFGEIIDIYTIIGAIIIISATLYIARREIRGKK